MPKLVSSTLEAPTESGAATLERGLSILEAFSDETPALTLAALARTTGLYKSTLLRLLASLEKFDYIDRQADGTYRLGHKGLRLGRIFQGSIQPAETVNPVLERLVESTSESAVFYVRRGDVRIGIYQRNGTQRVRVYNAVGDTYPLNRGAAGKVLLAFAPETHGDPVMDEVRQRMYAVTIGETSPEAAGVSAPVFNAAGQCEGALAITGPITRISAEPMARILGVLLDGAIELTLKFGGDARRLEMARRELKHAGRRRTASARTTSKSPHTKGV